MDIESLLSQPEEPVRKPFFISDQQLTSLFYKALNIATSLHDGDVDSLITPLIEYGIRELTSVRRAGVVFLIANRNHDFLYKYVIKRASRSEQLEKQLEQLSNRCIKSQISWEEYVNETMKLLTTITSP